MTLPNFLVLGAYKAGTTSLYYYLRHHPEIFMSPVKEPQFFTFDSGGPTRADSVTNLGDYEALFADAGSAKAIGEASTSYLYSEHAPGRIRDHIPDAKLIAVLRNPVDRAYSNYLHNIRDSVDPLADFGEALAAEGTPGRTGLKWRYKDVGLYSVQIERYLRHFAREQLLFCLYEDFDREPQRVLADIYRHLGVRDDYVQDLSIRLNVGGVPRSPRLQKRLNRLQGLKWAVDPFLPRRLRTRLLQAQSKNLTKPAMEPHVRSELLEFYRDDILRVHELTGLPVDGWLAQDAAIHSRDDPRVAQSAPGA